MFVWPRGKSEWLLAGSWVLASLAYVVIVGVAGTFHNVTAVGLAAGIGLVVEIILQWLISYSDTTSGELPSGFSRRLPVIFSRASVLSLSIIFRLTPPHWLVPIFRVC